MKHFFTTTILLLGLTMPIIAQQEIIRPASISRAVYFDVSPALRDMPVILPGKRDRSWKDGIVKNKLNMPEHRNLPLPEATPEDFKNAQTVQGTRESELMVSVNGVGNLSYVLPPDTQGDVGMNHYMQMVNSSFAIWNKAGSLVYGPVDNKTLWNGFPGPWSGSNDGDPIVLYDDQADRWIASQFALPNYPNGPFYEMIAVSQTGDPTGAWYRYAFTFTNMPDYPKLGVWRDGYYLSVNSFTAGSLNWNGTGVAALDRDKMLAGDPTASMVFFTTPGSGNPSSFLPADCDGSPAPEGTPGLFGYMRDGSPDKLVLYSLDVDWTTPANSAFTLLVTLPTLPFSSSLSGVAQQGTSTTLQAITDRLMYRLQYRNFGTYQSMVTNHTVNVSGHAGVKWYELRNYGSAWEIYQQGTYSPDASSRWMGSIAMNSYGDIALGYSTSSSSLYPSIRFTGRRSNDPLGEMTFAEQNIVAGGGSQTSYYQRWGDYSMMSVDPSADSVFWYTQEYYQSTSEMNWKTRIGSFSFGVPLIAIASVDQDTICAGASVQLTAEVNGGSGSSEYLWTSNQGSFTSNLPNPVVTPDVTTEYTLTVTNAGNTANSTIIVTVYPIPAVSVSDNMTVCEGTLVRVVATATGFSSLEWTSQGDGTFIDPTVFRADYMPGPQDIANGSVLLSVTAYSALDCTPATAGLLLTIVDNPTANAGETIETCMNSPVQLTGTATGSGSVLWTSAGDGTFNDPTLAAAIYTPGLQDIAAGSVLLSFTANGGIGCIPATDELLLTILANPTADAGALAETCSGNPVQLAGTATGNISVLWTSAGDGTFSDATLANAVYTPGVADVMQGTVELTFASIGSEACGVVVDITTITISKQAAVQAGVDQLICINESAELTAIANDFATLLWQTSGDGQFGDASAANTTYLPGPSDINNGQVELSITAGSAGMCAAVSDVLSLSMSALPETMAGNDTTICKTSSIQLNGNAVNASSTLWTTSGNGIFDNPLALNARYLPGTQDTINNSVMLTLTAQGMNNCGESLSQRTVQFAACLGISETTVVPLIRVLPNPTTGVFTVEISGLPVNLRFRVQLTNAVGGQIADEFSKSNTGSYKTTFDLSKMPKGIYLLHLNWDNSSVVSKVVLQ